MASAMGPAFDDDGCTAGRERVPRRYVVTDRNGTQLVWCPDRSAAEAVRAYYDRDVPHGSPHLITPE